MQNGGDCGHDAVSSQELVRSVFDQMQNGGDGGHDASHLLRHVTAGTDLAAKIAAGGHDSSTLQEVGNMSENVLCELGKLGLVQQQDLDSLATLKSQLEHGYENSLVNSDEPPGGLESAGALIQTLQADSRVHELQSDGMGMVAAAGGDPRAVMLAVSENEAFLAKVRALVVAYLHDAVMGVVIPDIDDVTEDGKVEYQLTGLGVQGVVILEAVVDADGTVRNVKVLKGLPMGLDQSAVEAVLTWRYEPARLEGRAVPVYFTFTISFSLT